MWWIVLAAFAGFCSGFFWAALLASGAQADRLTELHRRIDGLLQAVDNRDEVIQSQQKMINRQRNTIVDWDDWTAWGDRPPLKEET